MRIIEIALGIIIAWLITTSLGNSNTQNRWSSATDACGGITKLQWIQFSPLTGGFGFGCMPILTPNQ